MATNVACVGDMLIQDFWISLHADGQFHHMWLSWSQLSTEGMGAFLEYCVPNVLTEVFFLFSLELFVCLSGYGIIYSSNKSFPIQKNEFPIIVISMNLTSILYCIAQGSSYSCSSIVGYYQSLGKSNMAKKFAKTAIIL